MWLKVYIFSKGKSLFSPSLSWPIKSHRGDSRLFIVRLCLLCVLLLVLCYREDYFSTTFCLFWRPSWKKEASHQSYHPTPRSSSSYCQILTTKSKQIYCKSYYWQNICMKLSDDKLAIIFFCLFVSLAFVVCIDGWSLKIRPELRSQHYQKEVVIFKFTSGKLGATFPNSSCYRGSSNIYRTIMSILEKKGKWWSEKLRCLKMMYFVQNVPPCGHKVFLFSFWVFIRLNSNRPTLSNYWKRIRGRTRKKNYRKDFFFKFPFWNLTKKMLWKRHNLGLGLNKWIKSA